MKKKYLAIVVIAILIAITISFVQKGKEDYAKSILNERIDKNDFFANDKESPLKKHQKEVFSELNYYDVDISYRVKATLTRTKGLPILSLKTSDNKIKSYERYGTAEFKLNGVPQKLLVLKPTNTKLKNYYFIPFYDETTARETYGGGRYLEPEIEGNTVIIDFNLAYNPYCAYAEGFSCPIPPKENKLTVLIEAGEKNIDLPY